MEDTAIPYELPEVENHSFFLYRPTSDNKHRSQTAPA